MATSPHNMAAISVCASSALHRRLRRRRNPGLRRGDVIAHVDGVLWHEEEPSTIATRSSWATASSSTWSTRPLDQPLLRSNAEVESASIRERRLAHIVAIRPFARRRDRLRLRLRPEVAEPCRCGSRCAAASSSRRICSTSSRSPPSPSAPRAERRAELLRTARLQVAADEAAHVLAARERQVVDEVHRAGREHDHDPDLTLAHAVRTSAMSSYCQLRSPLVSRTMMPSS